MPSPTPNVLSAAETASGPASWNGGRSERSTSSTVQSRNAAPGMWPMACSSRPRPSTRHRQSSTRTPGRPRFSATQSGSADSSGRAKLAGTSRDDIPAHRDAGRSGSGDHHGYAFGTMAGSPVAGRIIDHHVVVVDPFLPEADKVAAVREALPATGAGIYLDTAAFGPLPAESARAAQEADEWELRVGRGGPDREADLAQRLEEARATLAALPGR